MIEAIAKNIDLEIEILRELSSLFRRLEFSNPSERRMLEETIQSLSANIKLINNSIPSLLSEVSLLKQLPSSQKPLQLEKIEFERKGSKVEVALQVKDREKFLQELSISENLIRRLKRTEKIPEEKFEEFKAARGYLKLANKFFLDSASSFVQKGRFKELYSQLKMANIEILFESYVAMMFFTTFLSFFVGILLMVFFEFFNVGLDLPFISFFEGNYLSRLLRVIWIPLATPILTFIALYFYPSTEKDSQARRIDQELPFAVVYMNAISGSGLEPSEIFKIIGLSKEYPYLKREIRKVLNQINIYGYDLITALTNTARSTPSSNLADLFNGLATTINSGGDLSLFLEKRAETLLLNYRLEREKYTRVAETFMDIYISVVIAAPMILMLLLIMISISGISIGLNPAQFTLLIITVVAFINILFLVFLHIKQPGY